MRYVSTRGFKYASLEDVILNGFAPDGGLYVPERIPVVEPDTLKSWSGLTFPELAFEVLSLFIEPSDVDPSDLRRLLDESFAAFDHPDVAPLAKTPDALVLELFHGPTMSFKDVAMGFLVSLTDHFLRRRNERRNVLVATTGDTGPAAAHAAIGRDRVHAWVLYPTGGFISDTQERQMTTVDEPNVHAVGVGGCADGGDDLDAIVAKLFADESLREEGGLGSVNSVNWGRVACQTVHYFWAHLAAVGPDGLAAGERVAFAVPCGAFGNLFAGYVARRAGLPIARLIAATNSNGAVHDVLATGVWRRRPLINTVSSAIDIVVPYNFWRTVYFALGEDADALRATQDEYASTGEARMPAAALEHLREIFWSASVDDDSTLATIGTFYGSSAPRPPDAGRYLMCPHTSVAAVAAARARAHDPEVGGCEVVVLATAAPCKFPEVIRRALDDLELDDVPELEHPRVAAQRELAQKETKCTLEGLENHMREALRRYPRVS